MKPDPPSFLHEQTPEKKIEILFRGYYVELCHNTNRLIKDRNASEDIVQEVFLKVWNRRHEIEFGERTIYYLKRSCYHSALLHLKKTLDRDSGKSNLVADTKQTDQPIIAKELENAVRTSLSTLPEKTRLIFSLSRYEDMTYSQIAEQMNLSIKSIEKHMGKALKSLREDLKDYLISIVFLFF